MLSNDDGRFDDPESDEEEILHDGLPPELQLLAKEVNGSFDDEEETLQDGLPPELQREQIERAGVDEVVPFDAGHDAFVSRPRDLAELLLRYA